MVTISKELFDDLLNCKLKQITDRINSILERWHYTSETQFLEDGRTGKMEEAESDAISLTNLLEKRSELYAYREKWSQPHESK